ncbi:MAG TPA: hypothetical protein VK467_12345, partial [Gemmatimonadales bacterium]|nr:hypothetical protein [Gemmatimonadales bacterium]
MKRHLSWPALAVLLVFLSGACGRDDAPGVTGISASAASGPSILRDVILFTTDELRPSSSQLAIIAPDGSGRRLLTNDEFRWREPAISPDGRRIAVSRSTSYDHTDGIYLMNADGSEPSLLIRHSAVFDGQPAWSPDGGQIAFMSSVEIGGFGPYGRIFVINVDGTGLRQLAEADGSESSLDEAPSWSPDGTRIVFTRNFMLHVINADGTGLIALPNEDFAVGATWSPDGRHIAYMSLDGSDIRMRNADGSNPVTVTAGGGPKWSPDSRRLVFSRIVG